MRGRARVHLPRVGGGVVGSWGRLTAVHGGLCFLGGASLYPFLVAFGVRTLLLGFSLLYFVAFCRRGIVRSFDTHALVLDAPGALGALVY